MSETPRPWLDFFARTGRLTVYPRSIMTTAQATFALVADAGAKRLAIVSSDAGLLQRFAGASAPVEFEGRSLTLRLCEPNGANAAPLRQQIPGISCLVRSG